jgi:CxxC motif-containing protein (DUF1111 family)
MKKLPPLLAVGLTLVTPFAPRPPPQPGAELAGLTADQTRAFRDGLQVFRVQKTAATGLGPIFNNVSCIVCHSAGGPGGASPRNVTHFGRNTNGVFDPLSTLGGSLLQNSAISAAAAEVIPRQANVIARRQSTPIFGAGLIEAIPEATLLQNEARPSVDGIRGKAARIVDIASGQNAIGRFGWKAQQATLLSFSGDAFLNEMGITNRLFPKENAPNGKAAVLAQFDKVADPEAAVDPVTGKSEVDRAADFMRLLAPPPTLAPSASAVAGSAIFRGIGCAQCHVPSMTTGPNAVAALSQKQVFLYSDLLLHDMGTLGDGIAQGAAGTREMKTAPLWGLRLSAPYLHDGRAGTVDQAIRAHEGEGSVPRNRYNQLTTQQRQQLLDFLNTI